MMDIFEIGIPSVELYGVDWVGTSESGHPHDYVGNWLWDDGGCILWEDNTVIAL